MYTLINLSIFILNIFYLNVEYIYIWKLFYLMNMNLTNLMILIMCRRCICCGCTHRQQSKCQILFDVMHREKDEIIGGLWWSRFYIWKKVNSIKRFFFKKHIKLKVTFTLKTINLMSYAANKVIWYAQLAESW